MALLAPPVPALLLLINEFNPKFLFQNTRVLSDFKERHILNLYKERPESEAQRKTSKPQCQPELAKLEISQQTRNLTNEQSVQSAPATMPPGHIHSFKFVFLPYYAGILYLLLNRHGYKFCKRVS